MYNFEGELYETCESVPEASELFWRFRVMDAADTDAAMADVLSKWAHKLDNKLGTRVCGVCVERV